MMDKITHDIDELIWRVAEAGDTELTADFLRRYPNLATALSSRQAMVDSMRGARPVPPIATRFVPSTPARANRRPLWLGPLAAGLLVGLALASYQIVKYAQSAPKDPEKTLVVNPQSPTPTPRDGRVITPTPTPNSNYGPGTAPRPDETTDDDGLVVLHTNGTTLFGALNAIKGKGLRLEIMPGVEDMPITLTANRDDGTIALEPLQMLRAVKAAAGFELVDNGPEGLLILPAENTNVIGENERVRSRNVDGN
ncbi:MAG: hypothetical protein ABIV13_06445 [Fimbriimonadales bacterium]